MRIPQSLLILIAVSAAVVGTVVAFVAPRGQNGAPAALRPVGLVEAIPFTVVEPYQHAWRKEQPEVTHGQMLVLAVDRTVAAAREGYEPVLYVGNQTAERVNVGENSGYLVVLVPGDVDLATAPLFFGTPALPEEVDAAIVAREVAAAKKAGVAPHDAATIERSQRPAIAAADHWELYLRAADLVEKWAPDEKDLVSGLRVPRIR